MQAGGLRKQVTSGRTGDADISDVERMSPFIEEMRGANKRCKAPADCDGTENVDSCKRTKSCSCLLWPAT
jgi:hypothetical protein